MSAPDDEADAVDIEELINHIKDSRGFDFSGYKRTSLTRRFVKRFNALGLSTPDEYRRHLDGHDEEYVELFNTILINVTSFFRDRDTWDAVREIVIPPILERSANDGNVRVWVCGCASGEEAYTLAMLLCDAMGEEQFGHRVKIYATDVDLEALAIGRHARYSWPALIEALPPGYAERYFEQDGSAGVFRKDLRRAVIFGRHDLVQDPPISRIDILSCRNTLMYFTSLAQTAILEKLRFALRHEGFLVLGRSEALATRSKLFTPVDLKRRVFARAAPTAENRSDVHARERPTPAADLGESASMDLRALGFDTSSVAQMIVDTTGTIAALNQPARALLGLSSKDVGRPLQDSEVSYRPLELRARIETVYAERHPVVTRGVSWPMGDEVRMFDIIVSPLVSPTGSLEGVGISFVETTAHARLQDELDRSRSELETAYEELQSTVEELETTNEELQSTNEELETTNEELQSTNEELETMNEELQSTNEELETINDELRQRTDELNDVNSFLESVLTSLKSAVIVVDRDVRVQVWSRHAADLWGLRADEVEGEHLMNLDIGLPVSTLHSAIRASLGADGAETELVVDAVNRRGRNISCRVRVTPLRRITDEITGVIMLMDVELDPSDSA